MDITGLFFEQKRNNFRFIVPVIHTISETSFICVYNELPDQKSYTRTLVIDTVKRIVSLLSPFVH